MLSGACQLVEFFFSELSAQLRIRPGLDIYGSEQRLKDRIAGLVATNPQGVDQLLELAGRYATGWRPTRFG